MTPWLLAGSSLTATLWGQALVTRHRDVLVAAGRWRAARGAMTIAWVGCAMTVVSAFYWIRA